MDGDQYGEDLKWWNWKKKNLAATYLQCCDMFAFQFEVAFVNHWTQSGVRLGANTYTVECWVA